MDQKLDILADYMLSLLLAANTDDASQTEEAA